MRRSARQSWHICQTTLVSLSIPNHVLLTCRRIRAQRADQAVVACMTIAVRNAVERRWDGVSSSADRWEALQDEVETEAQVWQCQPKLRMRLQCNKADVAK